MKPVNLDDSFHCNAQWEHPAVAEMHYEIREIVTLAKQLENLGLNITWENIGDPVQRGHQLPEWIRKIIKDRLDHEESYAYVSSQGHLATREFLANRNNRRGGAIIEANDILFFNGLGDAISTLYQCLHPNARVLIPSPVYSTHGAFERLHASGLPPLTYPLEPTKGWQPDLIEMEKQLANHPEVIAILMINPDNPTGMVQDRKTLQKIAEIARRYNICIIVDEVYAQVTWGQKHTYLSEFCSDVPAISLQGISKDLPWPGSRCGWMEFYNRAQNENFNKLVSALIRMKTMEVCATTLPQIVIPDILLHPNYIDHLEQRSNQLMQRAKELHKHLKDSQGLIPNESQGTLFGMITMDNKYFSKVELPPINQKYLSILKPHLKNASIDKVFVYYLLASTGICAVPLSSFHTHWQGIRITLLEKDEAKFRHICKQIQQAYHRFFKFNSANFKNQMAAVG